MKKSIILGTVVLLVAVTVAIQAGVSHPLLLITEQSIGYQIIRMTLVGLLLALVLTSPPRSLYFRVILGVFAVALFVGPLAMMLTYQISIVDSLLFNLIAIIFAIEAIEAPTLAESDAEAAVRQTA